MNRWFLLINPFAANGRTLREKDYILRTLTEAKITFDAAVSSSRENAESLVHEALDRGIIHFIAVGGDGTLNSLVNGIFSQQKIPTRDISLAIIPVGTGNDWIKTHAIPKSISRSIDIIRKGHTTLHDIGLITRKSSEAGRFFINVAGCAFQGFVAERIEGKSKWLKIGPIAFYFGLLEGLVKYKTSRIWLEADQERLEGNFFNISIGICRYAGGGMKLTPDAVTDDGLFDVTVAGNLNKGEVIKNVSRLFNGSFVRHSKVSQFRCSRFSARSTPLFPVETDGEVFGYGDIEATILQKAIKVVVP